MEELIQEGRLGDLIVIGVLVRKMLKPIEKTKAFQLGIIDKKGKRIKKPQTKDEKNAYTILDKFVFKLKRLLGHRVAVFSTFLLLLSDMDYEQEYELLMEKLEEENNERGRK